MCINENVITCDRIREYKQEFRIVFLTVDTTRIITPMENFTYIAIETNSVIFECSASGIPVPIISWFRINQTMSTMLVNSTQSLIALLPVNDTYELPNGRGTAFLVTSTLTIPATQDEDSGQYACQAVNDFGNETRQFELIVQGKLVCSELAEHCNLCTVNILTQFLLCSVAPVVTLNADDVETVEGMSATFLCAATGRPRPTITWYRTVGDSDTQERVNVSDVRVIVTEEEMGDRELMSNLTLRSVLPSDAVDYFCYADNGVGDDVVRSNATLTVNGEWFFMEAVCTTALPSICT